MATLREVSDGIAAAVHAVRPSIVGVVGRRRGSTGVAFSADLVVTAAHTVRRDEGLEVVLADGARLAATLVGRDPGTDLALLRVQGAGLTPATWADAAAVAVGAIVLPIGRTARGARAVLGIVSERGGPWQTAHGAAIDAWIDVDATLPPGFSGGPLVDADGRVVGLNTSALTPRGAVIPHATIARVVERLEKHGTVAPGYLGVGFYPGTLPDDLAAQAGQADALMAVSVEPGGPGERAGAKVGDALVKLDGQPVTGIRHLLGLLSAKGAGAEVTLTVIRAGAVQDVKVTLGARGAQPRGADGSSKPRHGCD